MRCSSARARLTSSAYSFLNLVRNALMTSCDVERARRAASTPRRYAPAPLQAVAPERLAGRTLPIALRRHPGDYTSPRPGAGPRGIRLEPTSTRPGAGTTRRLPNSPSERSVPSARVIGHRRAGEDANVRRPVRADRAEVGRDPALDGANEIVTQGHERLHDIRVHGLQERPPRIRQRLPVRQDDRVVTPAPPIAVYVRM